VKLEVINEVANSTRIHLAESNKLGAERLGRRSKLRSCTVIDIFGRLEAY